MSEKHVLDLLPAFVLGCLDEGECQVVNAHLDECECCRIGLQAYRCVLDDLPLRIALSEPPAEIRGQILRRAQQEGQLFRQASRPNPKRGGARRVVWVWMGLNLAFMVISTAVSLALWRRLNVLEGQTA